MLVKKKLNITRRRRLEGKTPQTTRKQILEGEKHLSAFNAQKAVLEYLRSEL